MTSMSATLQTLSTVSLLGVFSIVLFFTFANGTIWSDILAVADNALYCTASLRVFECRV